MVLQVNADLDCISLAYKRQGSALSVSCQDMDGAAYASALLFVLSCPVSLVADTLRWRRNLYRRSRHHRLIAQSSGCLQRLRSFGPSPKQHHCMLPYVFFSPHRRTVNPVLKPYTRSWRSSEAPIPRPITLKILLGPPPIQEPLQVAPMLTSQKPNPGDAGGSRPQPGHAVNLRVFQDL